MRIFSVEIIDREFGEKHALQVKMTAMVDSVFNAIPADTGR